jgi:hypothetical protein
MKFELQLEQINKLNIVKELDAVTQSLLKYFNPKIARDANILLQ